MELPKNETILSAARIIAEHKGAYTVKNQNGEFFAKITGKQIFNAAGREDFPAVGDWVEVSISGDQASIRKILPRRTVIKRKRGESEIQIIAANLDVAFAVESVDRDFNLNRFERYFALARDGGIRPAAVLNKIDLVSLPQLNEKTALIKNRFPNIDFFAISAKTGQGIRELEEYMAPDKTYCFLGSSGAGKSSLINRLIGEDAVKTAAISSYSGRGRHTTTARQMYFLKSGAAVIDNPGMREVGMADTGAGIDDLFGLIAALAQNCKYADCRHEHEPECAVRAAAESGALDEKAYRNYLNLKKETEYYEMTDLERRQKDRNFGKFIKTAKKQLKNLDY